MKGPHVTTETIEAEIAAEYAFTLGEALRAMGAPVQHPALDGKTIVALVFRNGFVVLGSSSVISPADFNAEVGHSFARLNAIEQAWPLFGWSLREKLVAQTARSAAITDDTPDD